MVLNEKNLNCRFIMEIPSTKVSSFFLFSLPFPLFSLPSPSPFSLLPSPFSSPPLFSLSLPLPLLLLFPFSLPLLSSPSLSLSKTIQKQKMEISGKINYDSEDWSVMVERYFWGPLVLTVPVPFKCLVDLEAEKKVSLSLSFFLSFFLFLSLFFSLFFFLFSVLFWLSSFYSLQEIFLGPLALNVPVFFSNV